MKGGRGASGQGKSGQGTITRVFGAPILIGIVSIVGLVAALLGDGAYDVLSWIGLLIPVLVIGWALRYRRG